MSLTFYRPISINPNPNDRFGFIGDDIGAWYGNDFGKDAVKEMIK